MPEKTHLGPDEYAELNSEGPSQFKKRSCEENPEASLGASVTAKGRKKFKTDRSSWNTSVSGGNRASENIRASGSWNLMIRHATNGDGEYGIVNEFDLTSIMAPGQASPTKRGFERSGTKPFMAIILLEAKPGRVIQRRCAHDLESAIWCLVWYGLLGIVDWRAGTYEQVGAAKATWIKYAGLEGPPGQHRTGIEHLWTPLTSAFYKWNQRQDNVLTGRWAYSDKANMELIDGFLPCPKHS